MQELQNILTIPAIALRGLAVFPGMRLHFDVARQKSVLAINEVMQGDQQVFLVAQKDMTVEDPGNGDLHKTGCIARIKQIVKLPGDALRVLVEGTERGRLLRLVQTGGVISAFVNLFPKPEIKMQASRKTALLRNAREQFEEYASLSSKLSPDVIMTVMTNDDPGSLSDFVASNIAIPLESRQYLLDEYHPGKRLEKLIVILRSECGILKAEHMIDERVNEQIDQNQREYYLREQLKAISAELGEGDNPQTEAQQYADRIYELSLPKESEEKLLSEAEKLYKMPPGSHEGSVIRAYLDLCLELPWHRQTKDSIDLVKAQRILDRDHYGLKKVKERIVELLAVRRMAGDMAGQIICLVGPPGVGKTSIARSIAKCMGRKYVRLSLGGVRDEADIRGHRKTYVGAMPGRIISAVKQAGVNNPLMLLDEVDKLGNDFRGDPASALLEALDSEQNSAFRDHYVEIPFDLSKVLFITTANTTQTIPPALLDRMELIELSSYTAEEKFHIAKEHLAKKQLSAHGLKAAQLKITDGAIERIIAAYTREAGVRTLERTLAALCRKAAREIVGGEKAKVVVFEKDLEKYLGPAKYLADQLSKTDETGLVNGLAWTSVGGTLMQLEALALEGSGKIVLTGSLGDVMKESAQTAVSCIRSRARDFGIPIDFYKTKDLHIHATEAAVPKDGPSAGITMTVALLSALSGIPVRRDVAMTGEISLRGKILPIGGLKEKTMAAYKAGIKTVILPLDNKPDLMEVDPAVREHLEFVPVSKLEEALPVAMTRMPQVEEPVKADRPYPPAKKDKRTAPVIQ